MLGRSGKTSETQGVRRNICCRRTCQVICLGQDGEKAIQILLVVLNGICRIRIRCPLSREGQIVIWHRSWNCCAPAGECITCTSSCRSSNGGSVRYQHICILTSCAFTGQYTTVRIPSQVVLANLPLRIKSKVACYNIRVEVPLVSTTWLCIPSYTSPTCCGRISRRSCFLS